MIKICLIGPMGSGKSTLAKQLSKCSGIAYVDMDQLIVETQQQSIGELFAKQGEAHFRTLEAACLEQQLNRPESLIISTGGGIVTQAINRERLKHHLTVYLKASSNVLFERTKHDRSRPLLTDASLADVDRLYQQRIPWYEACASLTIDTESLTLKQAVNALSVHLNKLYSPS